MAETAVLRAAALPSGGVGGRALALLTRLSDGAGLWVVVSAALVLVGGPRGRRAAARGAVALGAASALANGPVKVMARRRRPGRWATIGMPGAGRTPGTSSFPSGHTSSGFAFAIAAGLEAPALALPLVGTAAAVGWSRLQGGRHFPSDVLAGAVLGVSVAWTTRWGWGRIEARRRPGAPTDQENADCQ